MLKGEKRNCEDGWDLDRIDKWGDIRNDLDVKNAQPSEYRDAYNNKENTRLRCRNCNRSDNQLNKSIEGDKKVDDNNSEGKSNDYSDETKDEKI